MEARADIAKSKGFNAIEWDNVDGYTNNPGFPMTQAHQRTFNRMLAQVAHSRGLAVFLKNSGDDAANLEPYFDGAVIEQAYQYNEADTYLPFSNADKPGLICEYNTPSVAEINDANTKGFSLIKHVLNLDSKYTTSYVTNPPPAVALTDTQSPKMISTPTMNHSLTFNGLTPGQKYGFLIWSEAGSEIVYDPTPRNFIAN